MRHLVSIEGLLSEQVIGLVDKALEPLNHLNVFPGEFIGLIFLEPSSRTRVSFECAAHLLNVKAVYVEEKGSSLEKDETLKDTILNFRSMGIKVFVVRCKDEKELLELQNISGVKIINAGDGRREHPTQALLDLATLRSFYSWKQLKEKTLAIIGDLKSSRVAQSWSKLAPLVGINLRLISPLTWKPEWGGEWKHFSSLAEGLSGADFAMSLRVQKERHSEEEKAVTADFIKNFQLKAEHLGKEMMFMHPGPVNWGVELHEELQSDPQSLILLQAKYGVDLRRALLSEFFEALPRLP